MLQFVVIKFPFTKYKIMLFVHPLFPSSTTPPCLWLKNNTSGIQTLKNPSDPVCKIHSSPKKRSITLITAIYKKVRTIQSTVKATIRSEVGLPAVNICINSIK